MRCWQPFLLLCVGYRTDCGTDEETRQHWTLHRPSSPELEEHAALLLPLGDHLEGVQAAVAPVAVPAAERDEGAVEAVVPGPILVHVPEAVLICTDYKTQRCQMIDRAKKIFILLSKISYYLLFFLKPKHSDLKTPKDADCFLSQDNTVFQKPEMAHKV